MARTMETEEAARRLGVKPATLYAYVSRGLLASHPAPGGRRSLFDAEEVEALARRSRGGRRVETRLATVTTAVTQLRDGGPAYRGHPAVELAESSTYEAVAELLWAAEPAEWRATGGLPSAALPAVRWEPFPVSPPAELRTADRLRWAVVMAGAGDPLRADLRSDAVRQAGRRLVATMAAAAGPPRSGRPAGSTADRPAGSTADAVASDSASDLTAGGVAARLAGALAPEPTPELSRAIDTALVLLADHELATSTMGVRMAASTRADPYDAVLAGLAVLAGPLHGGASQLAYGLLSAAGRDGPAQALEDTLRWQRVLPGFGHSVLVDGDPRARVLLDRFAHLATPAQRDQVDAIVDLAGAKGIPPPNVDLGLAALTWAAGMPADAGRTLFSVARVAGWIAHYLEELAEKPLRFRARAVYAAPE